MKRMKKRISAVLAAALFLSVAGLLPGAADGAAPQEAYAAATFHDIYGHWAAPYIWTLRDLGIAEGNPDGTYRPDVVMKRGDFALMLYRAAGSPPVSGNSPFQDVSSRAYYAKAVKWASDTAIAEGYNGRFYPEQSVTREQAFTFMSRYLDRNGIVYDCDISALQAFSDRSSIAGFASRATAELAELGIIEGFAGQIQPKALLTRGAMAKILCRTLEEESR